MSLTFETIKNFSIEERKYLTIFFRFGKKNIESQEEYLKFSEKIKSYSLEDLNILKYFSFYDSYQTSYFPFIFIKIVISYNNIKVLKWFMSQNQKEIFPRDILIEAYLWRNIRIMDYICNQNPFIFEEEKTNKKLLIILKELKSCKLKRSKL